MDIRRLMLSLVIAGAILGLYYSFFAKPPETAATAPASQPAAATTTGPNAGSASSQGSAWSLVAGAVNDPVLIGSAENTASSAYPLQLSVSPRGGGLNRVLLNKYDATTEHKNRYVLETPVAGYEDPSRALTLRELNIDGRLLDLSTRNWAATSTQDTVNLSLGLKENDQPLLGMSRQYVIKPTADPSQGYEVILTQTIENQSSRQINVTFAMTGPTPPPREIDNRDDRQIVAGYTVSGRVKVVSHLLSEFSGNKSIIDLTTYKDGTRYNWIGASSAYFAALLLPGDPGQFAKVEGVALEQASEVEKVAIKITSTTVSLAPQQKQIVSMKLFFGPKLRSVVQSPYFSQLPMQYGTTLTTFGGSCSFCTFDWMVNGLVWLLGIFHMVTRDWGLAIILLVLLVRLVLHPITKKSTISMQKMGKMGPEIERLKKKYGDDKETLNREMMAIYKEQGVTPILGCLPMFLQMPIWIALWTCLQNTFELRQMPFLYGLTWIKDLAHADRLIYFPNHPVSFLFIHFDSINLLPILMGIVYYMQQKLQPKPPAMTEQQAQQQKIMGLMTLIFPIFLYNLPSGLNLYMVTSSTLGIIETKRIRDHIKRQEEAEKDGRVFVDAGPTRASKQMAKLKQKGNVTEAAKGGLAGWMARMQQRAEELRNEAERRKKDDRRK